MTEQAEPAPDPWPITVVARWRDPGYNERENRWWLFMLLGVLWAFGVMLIGGAPYPGLAVLALLILAKLGWQWIRRRPADIEMIVTPDELRIRATTDHPAVHLARDDAGWLLAAETGLDWQERFLLLTDGTGREVIRLRARRAAVQMPDASHAPESWWRNHMPEGSHQRVPPASLSVTALLGAWWPRRDRRESVRGNMGWRRPWKEPELRLYEAWDRRQRRVHAAVFAGVLLLPFGLGIAADWQWAPTTTLALLPPAIVGLLAAVRALTE